MRQRLHFYLYVCSLYDTPVHCSYLLSFRQTSNVNSFSSKHSIYNFRNFVNFFFNLRPVVFIIQVLKTILHKFILFFLFVFKKFLFKHRHAENKCIEIYC